MIQKRVYGTRRLSRASCRTGSGLYTPTIAGGSTRWTCTMPTSLTSARRSRCASPRRAGLAGPRPSGNVRLSRGRRCHPRSPAPMGAAGCGSERWETRASCANQEVTAVKAAEPPDRRPLRNRPDVWQRTALSVTVNKSLSRCETARWLARDTLPRDSLPPGITRAGAARARRPGGPSHARSRRRRVPPRAWRCTLSSAGT